MGFFLNMSAILVSDILLTFSLFFCFCLPNLQKKSNSGYQTVTRFYL